MGRGGRDGEFEEGVGDVGGGAGDVVEDLELEAADFGFPEGLGRKERTEKKVLSAEC